MLKIISCNNLDYREKLKKYLENDILKADKVSNSVKKIIAEVKKGGDRSLLSLTNKYEKNNFKNIKDLEVSKSEINNSMKQCTKDFIKSTKVAINRVKGTVANTPIPQKYRAIKIALRYKNNKNGVK